MKAMPKVGGHRNAAMLCALALVSGLGCGGGNDGSEKIPPAQSEAAKTTEVSLTDEFSAKKSLLKREKFSSCAELQVTIRDQLLFEKKNDKAREDYYKAHPEEVEPEYEAESSSEEAEPNAITNVQEVGVDEQDFVKVTDSSLYVLHQKRLEVIERKNLQAIGARSLEDEFPLQPDFSQAVTPLKMYSDGEQLTVIGRVVNHPGFDGEEAVRVIVFKTKPKALPTKIAQHIYRGRYVDSRYTDGHLYLVLKADLPLVPSKTQVPDQPVITLDGKVQGIPCNAIVKPHIPDLDFSLAKVVSLDMRDTKKKSVMFAVLGVGEGAVYMSRKNLYITKTGVNWWPWVKPGSQTPEDDYSDKFDKLFINQISLDPSKDRIELAASGSVQGFARNQFHFKEYQDGKILALATTSYQARLQQGKLPGKVIGKGLNHFWVLSSENGSLKLVNGLYHYGKPGEDLRAVRFTGDHAYLVTFRISDPLYVVDMTKPLQPRMLGELEVPGFSMYLHPVAKNRLVGIGYDAVDNGATSINKGIQVSLFDVKDQTRPQRLDNKLHGGRGSHSDITSTHHAFYFDKESLTFTVPLVEIDEENNWNGEQPLRFSGAVAYQLKKDRLIELGRATHRDLIAPACLPSLAAGWGGEVADSLDINRLIKLDGRWLSISRFGIKQHDPKRAFSPTKTLAFAGDSITCASDPVYE